MFSLLGKGRPLTGALLFRARKGGGCVRRWFARGEFAGGWGPQGRPQAAPRLRPAAGAPCGPVLGRNLQDGKGDGFAGGRGFLGRICGEVEGDGFADRGRGRRGGGGRRPPPAPAAGRTVRRTVQTGAARRFRRSRNGLRPALSPLGKAPPMRYNRGRAQGKRGAAP